MNERRATYADDYEARPRQGRRDTRLAKRGTSPAADRRRHYDRPAAQERVDRHFYQRQRPRPPTQRLLSVEQWGPEDVAQWIASLSPDFNEYADSFERHHIRGSNLQRLDYVLLSYLGVQSVGHQIDILQAIDRLFPERLPPYSAAPPPSEASSSTARRHSNRLHQYHDPGVGPSSSSSASTDATDWAAQKPRSRPNLRPAPDPKWFYPSDDEERAASLYRQSISGGQRWDAAGYRRVPSSRSDGARVRRSDVGEPDGRRADSGRPSRSPHQVRRPGRRAASLPRRLRQPVPPPVDSDDSLMRARTETVYVRTDERVARDPPSGTRYAEADDSTQDERGWNHRPAEESAQQSQLNRFSHERANVAREKEGARQRSARGSRFSTDRDTRPLLRDAEGTPVDEPLPLGRSASETAAERVRVRDSGIVASPSPARGVTSGPEEVEFVTSPSHRVITPPTLFRQPSVGSDRPDDVGEMELRPINLEREWEQDELLNEREISPGRSPARLPERMPPERTPSISSQQTDTTNIDWQSSLRRESKSKRIPVVFSFMTEHIEANELIAHRLAAILQLSKRRIESKMQIEDTTYGRGVVVLLEPNNIRHLRHLLETDRNSLAPIGASSIQIGNEKAVPLQRPKSLMRALEDSHLRTQNSHFLKVIVIGDTGCGKTSFIRASVSQEKCTDDYTPTVFDTFDCCVSIGKEPVVLQVHDTGSLDGYEKLRSESYRDADAVVICFNIGRQSSLHNVEDCWHPEVRMHGPDLPVIVAGLQRDRRDEYERNPAARLYRSKHYTPVQEEMGRRISRSVHAVHYGECSALNLVGMKALFDHVVYVAYEHKKLQCKRKPKSGRCIIL